MDGKGSDASIFPHVSKGARGPAHRGKSDGIMCVLQLEKGIADRPGMAGSAEMSGVPYIRFFGDDWLSGTQELSLEERGALVTIVSMTATIGSAPALDYMRLSRRFGCTPGKAKKVIQALVDLGKITIEDGAISNKRALIETEISQKYSQKQSENASARWSKQTQKSNENNEGLDATAMPRQCQPEPEPEPYKKKEAIASKEKPITRSVQLPAGWVPNSANENYAREKGLSDHEIRNEGEKFRDYHAARGSTFKDWDAAWRTWIRNAQQFAASRGGTQPSRSNPASGQQLSGLAGAAMRSAARRSQGI